MLERLRLTKSLNELESFVQDLFSNNEIFGYIPAVINQGNFTMDKGEDFYLKLVMCHQKTSINETWIKENMTMGIISPNPNKEKTIYDYLIYNVITHRNVKGGTLYQLNPNIICHEIEEYEYDNNKFVNMFFNDEYSKVKGKPVLVSKNDDLYIYKNVFKDYLNDPDGFTYPKYKLIAEIEYRTHNNKYLDVNQRSEENKRIGDTFFNTFYSKGSMQIKASIDLGTLNTFSDRYSQRNVKVLEFDTLKYRSHNPQNFDGDTNAGFVVFKTDVIETLNEDYYIYDLTMYDKKNAENYYMIDILDDKVVLWEGEYNKLPVNVKDKIDKYNQILQNPGGVISPGMAAWQLEVDWNFQKKMYPEQQLASIIKRIYFNKAIDMGITFSIPRSIEAFSDFIIKIEAITLERVDQFNQSHEDVIKLMKIRAKEYNDIDFDEIPLLFRKYCYQIGKVLDNELFE